MYTYILINVAGFVNTWMYASCASMIGVYGDLDAVLRERTEDVALSG